MTHGSVVKSLNHV